MIQEANIRALSGGVTTDNVFDMVAQDPPEIQHSDGLHDLRQCGLLLRYRPFHEDRAEKSVMDGLILPDVPYEEKEEFDSVAKVTVWISSP